MCPPDVQSNKLGKGEANRSDTEWLMQHSLIHRYMASPM